MTEELKPCPFEKAKWRGESSNNPQKGWIVNSHGNRITSLGNRTRLGKIISEHNNEIDILKSRNTRHGDK